MKPIFGMRGRVALAEMERRKRELEYQAVVREAQAAELMQRARSGETIDPAAFLALGLKGAAAESGADFSDDPRQIAANEIRRSAYDDHVGLFLERRSQGHWKLWDFAELIDGATTIELETSSTEGLIVSISYSEGADLISGPAVDPFMRYLHYLGVFESLAARVPCACAVGPGNFPQDCETCGGLGWVLRPAEVADGL